MLEANDRGVPYVPTFLPLDIKLPDTPLVFDAARDALLPLSEYFGIERGKERPYEDALGGEGELPDPTDE